MPSGFCFGAPEREYLNNPSLGDVRTFRLTPTEISVLEIRGLLSVLTLSSSPTAGADPKSGHG